MRRMLVFFNLKSGTDVAAYEAWAKDVDIPTVRNLPSVSGFTVHKCSEALGDAQMPHDYVEIIDVNDVDGFFQDISTEEMKAVAAQFSEFTDDPVFVWTDPVETAN